MTPDLHQLSLEAHGESLRLQHATGADAEACNFVAACQVARFYSVSQLEAMLLRESEGTRRMAATPVGVIAECVDVLDLDGDVMED